MQIIHHSFLAFFFFLMSTSLTWAEQLNCPLEVSKLLSENDIIQSYVPSLSLGNAALKTPDCPGVPVQNTNSVETLHGDIHAVAKALTCSKENKETVELSCMAQLGCNLVRSSTVGLIIQASAKMNSTKLDNSTSAGKCLGGSQSSCLSEFVTGALKDLWSNVDATWGVAKAVANWAKNNIVKGWHSLIGVEDKTSEAALAASQTSDSLLKKLMKDPKGAVVQFGEDLFHHIGEGIKNTFMCSQWSGAPHISKCLKPGEESWSCASCDQKMNAICGVIGFAGGEILTAYLTGGAINFAKVAAKNGIEMVSLATRTSLAVEAVARPAIAASKLAEFGSAISRNITKAQEGIATLRQSLSKAVGKIKETNLVAAGISLGEDTLKVASKAYDVVTYPLTPYFKAIDYAREMGLSIGKSAGEGALGATKKEASRISRISQEEELQEEMRREGSRAELTKEKAKEPFKECTRTQLNSNFSMEGCHEPEMPTENQVRAILNNCVKTLSQANGSSKECIKASDFINNHNQRSKILREVCIKDGKLLGMVKDTPGIAAK